MAPFLRRRQMKKMNKNMTTRKTMGTSPDMDSPRHIRFPRKATAVRETVQERVAKLAKKPDSSYRELLKKAPYERRRRLRAVIVQTND